MSLNDLKPETLQYALKMAINHHEGLIVVLSRGELHTSLMENLIVLKQELEVVKALVNKEQ